MAGSEFDVATQRLSGLISRRRSLSLVAASSLGAILLVDAASAGKKGKRGRRPCRKKCFACNLCKNNKCIPVADGTTCGTGVCISGACAIP